MADLPTNLRTFLLTQTAITSVVGQNVFQAKVPANREVPYVWFGRVGSAPVDLLNPEQGLEPDVQMFALECVCGGNEERDLDLAQQMGDAMRALNNYRGTLGTTTVQALFVSEQNDDYEYRTIMGDEGFHTCAFSLEIYPN